MESIEKLLQDFKDGKVSQEKIVSLFKKQPFIDIGVAKLDYHREIRSGFPEVIFGLGKSVEQINEIARHMYKHSNQNILITRTTEKVFESLSDMKEITFDADAKLIQIQRTEPQMSKGYAVVLTAGTSDIPVAKEAVLTAKAMGCCVKEIYDVGVCGVHRLLSFIDVLQEAKVIIVVAGMEGALCSVTAGLVSCPVIGVPTSIGYGASFGGVAALLSMINSCANRVSVVNIDNGYGAGCIAASIAKVAEK